MSESAPTSLQTSNGPQLAAGITAVELVARATMCVESPLSERALERWLVAGRLAERRGDGLLYATPRGLELAGGLD